MNGWFAMNRAMFSHPIFEGNPDRVAAWAWMIATAAWKDVKQNANGKTVTVKRGQLLTSYRQMSKATGVSIKSLRNLILRLKGENAVVIDTGTGRLLITIRNYDKYQSKHADGGTGEGTARAQQGHTKEQGNKGTTVEANASLSSGDDEKALIAEAVFLFKATAKRQGWPVIRTLSKARQAALRARLRDAGADGWSEALSKASASSHCNGHNNRGWVCDFDFLTAQSTFNKLLEGSYDDRPSQHNQTRNAGRSNPHDSLVAGFAAFANSDDSRGEPDLGCGEAFDGPGNDTMDFGSGGNTSQPIFRVIGSN